MHYQPFDRLVRALDEYARESNEKTVIQIGVSNYVPRHSQYARFFESDAYERLVEEASVVVSHAGAGTVIDVLCRGKPLILMPRERKYGELNIDHQLELALALQDAGQSILVHDMHELHVAMRCLTANPRHSTHSQGKRCQLTENLTRYLTTLSR